MSCASRLVPDDDDVSGKGFKVANRILESFPFLEGRGFGGEIDDVSSQSLSSQLKTDARAGRRFDKKVDHCLASEGGNLLDGPLADLLEHRGSIKNGQNLTFGKTLNI